MMRNVRHIFFLALMLMTLLAVPVRADEDDKPAAPAGPAPQELIVIDRGTVKEVLKSDMIMLNNNRRYRLDNILVPPFEDPPAIEELKNAFLNKNVIVYAYHTVDDDQDRYGVPFSHIMTEKGVWIQ